MSRGGRRSGPRFGLVGGVGLVCCLAFPLGAAAQTVIPDSVAGDTIRPVLLPPLQVRVLRTPMGLEEAPLSISNLGRVELFGGRSGASLEETLQAIPGLQIQNRYNFSTGERIVLRGIGARTQFGVRGLRILIDGIPATLPDGQSTLDHLDLFSLGSVEVLRGPGAALYGNGAGGVLRFSSRPAPGAGEPLRPEALFLAGSHGLFRASALLSGTVAETGYLISLGRFSFDGFRSNTVAGQGVYGGAERSNGNVQLTRWVAGGRMALTLTAVTQDSENPGSLSRALLGEDPTQAYPFNVRQRTGEEVEQGSVGLVWEREWRGVTVEFGSHGIRRELWNPIPPAIIDLSRKAGGVRGGVRGRWEAGVVGGQLLTLNWNLGLEGEGQWDRRQNLENDGGEAGALTLDQDERVSAKGVFGQTRIDLGPDLSVLAGARYDRIGFEVSDHLIEGGDPDDSGRRTLDALSPSLGARFSPRPGITLRISASTFFQTPTTSELANQPSGAGGFNPRLDPQRGRSVEMGVKVGSRRVAQMELTLFRTLLLDELIPFEVPDRPGRVFFRNAGESIHKGLELATTASGPRGLSLRGAYTYTDSRFQEFSVEGEDLEGNQIPGVAPHRVDVVLHWDVSGWGIPPGGFLEVRGLYQGRTPANDGNTSAASPYALWELRGGLGAIPLGRTRWTVFGGVSNLLDRGYTTSVSVNAFGGRYFEPGPGRSGYLGIRIPSFSP